MNSSQSLLQLLITFRTQKNPTPKNEFLGTRFSSWCHPCSSARHRTNLIRYCRMNRTIPQLYNGSSRRHIPRGEFHSAARSLVSIHLLYPFSPAELSTKDSLMYCSLHRVCQIIFKRIAHCEKIGNNNSSYKNKSIPA